MDDVDRITRLLDKGKGIAEALGLSRTFIERLWDDPSDWSFVLKADALVETAGRALIGRTLNVRIGQHHFGGPDLQEFVERLPATGRSSLEVLLRAAGCPPDRMKFLDALRRIRNYYAHDIALSDEPLLAVLLQMPNHKEVMAAISAVQRDRYDYELHVKLSRQTPSILRLGIFQEALQYLGMSYRQWGDGEEPG